MKIVIGFFVSLFLLNASIVAENVIYVVIEGVSRKSLYSLLKKNKLPHLNKIAKQGNYRNIGIDLLNPTQEKSRHLVYTGQSVLLGDGAQNIYSEISSLLPDLDIRFFLTEPVNAAYNKQLSSFFKNVISQTESMPLSYLTSSQLGGHVSTYIETSTQPFFITLNFSNVDYIGWRYREGAQLYSQALINCDRSIGNIVKALSKKGIQDQTTFLIITSYGYKRGSKDISFQSWGLSNRKILRKGSLRDVFPTLFDVLDISDSGLAERLAGRSLFQR
ncbi:hypothetical protein DID78_00835 [Candidatus Marinamargulisbacteria bacterium SCGC AG-343-D04]|nr:hypothetical protein DID78_00835 [Candidatus Marinamargulisbacteria bacterium SCGC AG-343-D04]